MKGLATKMTAMLLVIWYSMSIIGFDVHTCSRSGRSFVVTFIEGLACEDVHPEHSCSHVSCCDKDHGCCCSHSEQTISSGSCCSTDYQVLTITGTVTGEESEYDTLCLYPYFHDPASSYLSARLISHTSNMCRLSYPGAGRAPDLQPVLGVWRI
jgi:hypothetical protein